MTVAPDGTVSVEETGDHLGRRGLDPRRWCRPGRRSVRPAAARFGRDRQGAGALIGKFTKHKVESGLGDKFGAALPPGTAGIVAIYDRSKAALVSETMLSAVTTSVAEIDGGGIKSLKAALAEAQAGMGGG